MSELRDRLSLVQSLHPDQSPKSAPGREGHLRLRVGRTCASKAGQLLGDSVRQCRPQDGLGSPTWLLMASVRHLAADL